MARTPSKLPSLRLVTAFLALSVALAGCSLGSDLDVASAATTGGEGGGGGADAAGGGGNSAQAGASQGTAGSAGGASVSSPSCAATGATSVLRQGTARLDLDVPGEATWDLEGGAFGQTVKDGIVYNRESHLDYGRGLQKLSVGIQGGDDGVILDLGSENEVATRLLATAPCTGFDRVAVVGGQINDPNGKGLFQAQPEANASATAVVGHVYVLRVVRKGKSDVVAKLRVTAVEERAVSFAWATLAPPSP